MKAFAGKGAPGENKRNFGPTSLIEKNRQSDKDLVGVIMLISAGIVGFIILGLFFHMLTSSPRNEAELPVRPSPRQK